VQLEDEAGGKGSVEERGVGPSVSELYRGVNNGKIMEWCGHRRESFFDFPTNHKKIGFFWWNVGKLEPGVLYDASALRDIRRGVNR
jgi:hypothetical protein